LNTLQASFKTNKKLEDFFLNPVLQRQAKANAINDICEKSKFSSGATNLLVALAENGRLKKLNPVINAFKTIMSAHRGDLPCEVIAAKPLDDQTIKALQGVLKAFAKKGENVILEVKVDPSIIGGLIVSIGDKYVDMSI
ncbi:ATP synthase F1 subunit delta, partial [bacterium LRH843]|nr:ATP synthase F1 subunit delta [bacterium LRH843]